MDQESKTSLVHVRGRNGEAFHVRLHCPWCETISEGNTQLYFHAKNRRLMFVLAQCRALTCGRGSLVIADERVAQTGMEHSAEEVHPTAVVKYAPEGVPDELAKDFEEALGCAEHGHYLGAALVARRVLQGAAREVIGKSGANLAAEIEAVSDERLNRQLKQQAHEVRLIGNDAAHNDKIDPADVEELLDFCGQVLEALYVSPLRIKKLQEGREARRKKGNEPEKKPSKKKDT